MHFHKNLSHFNSFNPTELLCIRLELFLHVFNAKRKNNKIEIQSKNPYIIDRGFWIMLQRVTRKKV